MNHHCAQRQDEPAANSAWSSTFKGASGDWPDAGGRRVATPIVAYSPDGVVIGSLDIPMAQRPRSNASEGAGLARLRRRLAEADREQERCRRIMVTAGHDLRQPLQVLAMILDRAAFVAPGDDGLDLLEVAMSQIGRLSDGLRDLARAAVGGEGAGAAVPNPRPFWVSDAMDAAIERWAHHIRSAGTEFRYVRSGVAAVSDPALLATVLDNLLGNALKYAKGGRVLFGCRRHEGRLAIEVLDTGPGMTESQLEACRGGRASSSSGGLGLGLYIVHRTLDLLGLDLLVASEPGRGSRFAVYLPVA